MSWFYWQPVHLTGTSARPGCLQLFHVLSDIAAICEHAADAHQSIAGVRDEHGIYLSRRSAAYPKELAEAFANKVAVLLSPSTFEISWDSMFSKLPIKEWGQDPKSFVDGGGLISNPDWSFPPPSAERFPIPA